MQPAPAEFGDEFLVWLCTQLGSKPGAGLSDAEIDDAERTFALRFPPDYRRFLHVVGAPSLGGKSFYDWRRGRKAIVAARAAPLDGLVFEVLRDGLWREDWGPRPADEPAIRKRLASVIAKHAAPLVPVSGHRYLVGAPLAAGNPVLSIHQTDIIVYGYDLRSYLLHELFGHAGSDDPQAYERARQIPFWGSFP